MSSKHPIHRTLVPRTGDFSVMHHIEKMIKTPEIVNDIVRAVSEKLGREAILRKVNSREEYFVLDLAFSYFQKADRNRRNDYRSGYLYYRIKDKNYLLFVLAHTPIMTAFFKNNFDYEVFRNIIIDTEKYRDENYLCFKRNSKKKKLRQKTFKSSWTSLTKSRSLAL